MLYPDESYRIMGACFEVHNRQGCGFLEPVYQECLEIELEIQEISFVAQPELQLSYRERVLKQRYKPDFICYDRILLEIKAVEQLTDKHEAGKATVTVSVFGVQRSVETSRSSNPNTETLFPELSSRAKHLPNLHRPNGIYAETTSSTHGPLVRLVLSSAC